MYKKVINFENYDGESRSMEVYCSLTEAEVVELEVSWDGGLRGVLEKIIEEKDQKRMVEMMKMLITKSYGKKSIDGNKFIKNQEVLDDFMQSPAYSELFMLLSTDADEASAFVNGIIPKKLAERAAELEKQGGAKEPIKIEDHKA